MKILRVIANTTIAASSILASPDGNLRYL
jgi:hypothetical protein